MRRAVVAVVSGLCFVLQATPAASHTPSTVFNWTRLARFVAAPGKLTFHYSLAAGDVLGQKLREGMDEDRDGVLDEDEKRAFVTRIEEAIAPDLRLAVDGRVIPMRFTERRWIIDGAAAAVRPISLDFYLDVALDDAPGATHSVVYDDRSFVLELYDNLVRIEELDGCELCASRLEDRSYMTDPLPDASRSATPSDGLDGCEPALPNIETLSRWPEQDFAFREPTGGGHYRLSFAYRVTQEPGAKAVTDGGRGSDPSRAPGIQFPAEQSRMSALVAGKDLSLGFVLFAFGVALVLGAFHALSPGHGKTVVAAYLVGAKGTVRHAFLLGLIVTTTHVASVVLLGLVTLWLSQYVVPEKIYPWLGFSSGLLIVLIGGWMFVKRLRIAVAAKRSRLRHDHDHVHDHHGHGHGHHDHDHGHAHDHGHDHVMRHADDSPVSFFELLVLGVTGGMVPCPSALVVLLSAVALHRIAFGLALIGVFSIGLASVLILIGVVVVKAGNFLSGSQRMGWLVTRLPVASAVVVTVLGAIIAVQALVSGGILTVRL